MSNPEAQHGGRCRAVATRARSSRTTPRKVRKPARRCESPWRSPQFLHGVMADRRSRSHPVSENESRRESGMRCRKEWNRRRIKARRMAREIEGACNDLIWLSFEGGFRFARFAKMAAPLLRIGRYFCTF